MKLAIMGAKGGNFEIEMSSQARIVDVKQKIEEVRPDWLVAAQRIIYLGKELLDDNASLTEANLKEGNPLVVMLRSGQTASARCPASATPTQNVVGAPPRPASARPMTHAVSLSSPSRPPKYQDAEIEEIVTPGVVEERRQAAARPPGAVLEASLAPVLHRESSSSAFVCESDIQQLCSMGFERDQASACLKAAFGNLERAIEYLTAGIPEHIQRMHTAKTNTSAVDAMNEKELMRELLKHASGPDDARAKIEKLVHLQMSGQDVSAHPDLLPLVPIVEQMKQAGMIQIQVGGKSGGKGKGKGNGYNQTDEVGSIRACPEKKLLNLGSVLLRQGLRAVSTEDALVGVERIGLYFGGKWCPHCPRFSAKLKRWYEEYKKWDPGFEVIYISVDRNEAEANAYFVQDMGEWLMRPYSSEFGARLSSDFSINSIPSFVVCSLDGSIISRNALSYIDIPPNIVAEDCLFHILETHSQVECSQIGSSNEEFLNKFPPGVHGIVQGFDEDSDPVIQSGSDASPGIFTARRIFVRPLQRGRVAINEESARAAREGLSQGPATEANNAFVAKLEEDRRQKMEEECKKAEKDAAERRAKMEDDRMAKAIAERKEKEHSKRLVKLEQLLHDLQKQDPAMAKAAVATLESFIEFFETQVSQEDD